MKTIFSNLMFFLLTGILLISCTKNEEDPLLEENYDLVLEVSFSNIYPDWLVKTVMSGILTDAGDISINEGSLSYSGEKLVSDVSKLTRSGRWDMSPEGRLEKQGGLKHIIINPHISVVNDITRVYAKNDQGEWELVGEAPYTGNITSELSFSFDEAINISSGAVARVSESTGSIVWTLNLMPAISPLK